MRKLVLIVAMTCGASAQARMDQVCELNGKEVNLNNGASTAGKTGMMRCKENGKVVREEEYKNGVHVGHEMMIDFQGNKIVRTVNEKHNAIGVAKTFNAAGVLIREETYGPGRGPGWTERHGITRAFYNNGKLQHIAWFDQDHAVFEASYLEKDGKLERISCGKQSYFEGDRELCGWSGKPSRLQLNGTNGVYQTRVYLNGKLQENAELDDKGNVTKREELAGDGKKKTEFYPNGKIKIEAQYREHALHGDEKEYHSSGKLVRLTNWDNGNMVREETYYLNGQKKSRAERKQVGKLWRVARQEFWDTGKVKDEGVFLEKADSDEWYGYARHRWIYETPVGVHRSFYENGQLEMNANYNDKGERDGINVSYFENGKTSNEEKFENGVRKSAKQWNTDGKVILNEEYLEDGSRVRH